MASLPLHRCDRCPHDDDDGFAMFAGCASGIAAGAVLIAIIENASAVAALVGGLI